MPPPGGKTLPRAFCLARHFLFLAETLAFSTDWVSNFRGAVFNEAELAHQLRQSGSFTRLLKRRGIDSHGRQPPLPLSIGQVGLIGGSGLINGLMDCAYPHIIKGRIVKERTTRREENRTRQGALVSTTHYETISNRMIFNILTPNGFRSLT